VYYLKGGKQEAGSISGCILVLTLSISIVEGELQKNNSGKKASERYGYLFDGFMFLCKPNYRRTSVVSAGSQHEYRLKESFYLTKVEVRDKEDTEGKLMQAIIYTDFSMIYSQTQDSSH